MQSMKLLRSPMTWGLATLAVMTVVALVAASLYVSPPDQRTITFYTDDAASVHPGDQVRIAGIPVGKVSDLSLERDRVRVRARVDDSAFVGDQSQVEVRMLTVVGGYYVNLVSVGRTALGRNDVIPRERVTMPYSLIRSLNDATGVTDKISATPINQSLNEIQAGLRGRNAEALNAVVEAGNSLMSSIDKQRGQITAILNMSDEYIQALSGFRETFEQMTRKISLIEATLELYSKGVGAALKGLGDALAGVQGVAEFYDKHRDDFLTKVREFIAKGRMWIDRNGVIVRGLRVLQRHFERILDIQQAPPELLATDLCFPMPGSPCR